MIIKTVPFKFLIILEDFWNKCYIINGSKQQMLKSAVFLNLLRVYFKNTNQERKNIKFH